MHETPEPIDDYCALLERCLGGDDQGAWQTFLSCLPPLARQAMKGHQQGPLRVDELIDWLPGWMFERRRVHALYRALLAKRDSGECPTTAALAAYARHYLFRMVQSAIGDWYRQSPGSSGGSDAQELLAQQPAPPVAEAPAAGGVEDGLARLTPDLRVPFWLRHYRNLGPLSQADLEWLAARTGAVPAELARELDGEAGLDPDRKHPFSSARISALMGLERTASGAYAAVDQRVARARDQLKKMLAPPQPAPEEGQP